MSADKLEYENELIQLYCDEAYRYVFVRFKENNSFSAYSASIQKIMDVLRHKKMKYLILDVSHWTNVANEINGRNRELVFSQLSEYGLKKFGIISGLDKEKKSYMIQQINSGDLHEIKLRHCLSFEDAEDWIIRIN